MSEHGRRTIPLPISLILLCSCRVCTRERARRMRPYVGVLGGQSGAIPESGDRQSHDARMGELAQMGWTAPPSRPSHPTLRPCATRLYCQSGLMSGMCASFFIFELHTDTSTHWAGPMEAFRTSTPPFRILSGWLVVLRQGRWRKSFHQT